ncbi:hypothetical protein D3C71_803290 [compost metagenome]
MLPAHQHLSPGDLAQHVYLRLQVQPQLARADGLAQLALHAKALLGRLAHALLEEGRPPTTGLLGAVQRRACTAQGVVRNIVGALRIERDAHARTQLGFFGVVVLQVQRPQQRCLQLFGKGQGTPARQRGIGAQAVEHHGKFVARHTHQQALGGQYLGQAQRHGAQQAVAHLAAACIVEGGEAVQVQQQQRVLRGGRAARAALQRRQSLHQREAVGQAGEAVEMRQAVDFLRCALALGDVLLELYIVADVAVGLADGGHHHGLGNLGAVLAAVGLFARPVLAAGQRVAQPLALRWRQAVT